MKVFTKAWSIIDRYLPKIPLKYFKNYNHKKPFNRFRMKVTGKKGDEDRDVVELNRRAKHMERLNYQKYLHDKKF